MNVKVGQPVVKVQVQLNRSPTKKQKMMSDLKKSSLLCANKNDTFNQSFYDMIDVTPDCSTLEIEKQVAILKNKQMDQAVRKNYTY